jgi:hypothetical protein
MEALEARYKKLPDLMKIGWAKLFLHTEPRVITEVFIDLVCNTGFLSEITSDSIKEKIRAIGGDLGPKLVSRRDPECKACRGVGHVTASRIRANRRVQESSFGCPEGCTPSPATLTPWQWSFMRRPYNGDIWALTYHHDEYVKESGYTFEPFSETYEEPTKEELEKLKNVDFGNLLERL